jgi:Flp pilus assembly protein CpaB
LPVGTPRIAFGPVNADSPGRGRPDVRLLLARLAGWPRMLLAAVLFVTAGVVWLADAGVRAGDRTSPGVPVLVAARDLAGGATVGAADVRPVPFAPERVPAGALAAARQAVGQRLSGPVRRGEPITDARLLGLGLATGLSPESVAVPVRLADGGTAALLRPGDRVDLLAVRMQAIPGGEAVTELDPQQPADAGAGGRAPPPDEATEAGEAGRAVPAARDGAPVVAAGVRVLAVVSDAESATTDGVLIVVAASDNAARRIVAAGASAQVSVVLRG